MPTTHPYDLVSGLDRSDRKADLHLIDTRTGTVQKQTVATSPEALHDWLVQLRQNHPQARVAICLEQPAANLIVFLETYSWITLYPINPISLQKFREAFVTSRAKDDGKHAQYLAELLLSHPDNSRPFNSSINRSPKFFSNTPTAGSSKPSPGPDRCWRRGCWPAWARSANDLPSPKICNPSAGSLR